MEEGLLDISFGIKPVNMEKFIFIPLATCYMMLLANKNNFLAHKSAVSFKDLANERFIMLSSEYKSRQLTIEHCMKSGFIPNIFFTASQTDLIIELVALNKGIAILPVPDSLRVAKYIDEVSAVSIQDPPFIIEIGFIISRRRSLNYITNTLINYTLKFFKDKKWG